ncbi:MAG: DUF3828 domain-containing protein [Hyphomonadaceae bacterium]
MIGRRGLVLGAGALALAACTRQAEEKAPETAPSGAPDPADAIRPLYDPYLTEGSVFPDFEHQAPWSDNLWEQLQAMMARSQAMNEPILDFDPLIDAQDYQLSNLVVRTDGVVEHSHAVVRAQFDNAGRPSEVLYDLVWENDSWRVDNIRTSAWDLRAIAAGP